MVKVKSLKKGLKAKSFNPPFELLFETTDTVHDISEEAAEKLCRNPTFVRVDDKPKIKKKKKDTEGDE